MGIMRNDKGKSVYPCSKMLASEDTSFVAGDSPRSIDVNNDLGVNGNRGHIKVDGAGDLLVEITHGGTNYEDQFTLKNGDAFDLTGLDIDTIRLTHSGTNTAYRILVW